MAMAKPIVATAKVASLGAAGFNRSHSIQAMAAATARVMVAEVQGGAKHTEQEDIVVALLDVVVNRVEVVALG